MQHFPVILAHGALGPWDEVIFLIVAAIFLIVMGISWVKSRVTSPLADVEDSLPEAESAPAVESPDRFRLD